MWGLWLYLFLLKIIVFPGVSNYELSEEAQKDLEQVCEEANQEIRKTGMLREPHIAELFRPTPSATWMNSAAVYFALPYILFDPLNQSPTFFMNENVQLLCPLCSRAGLRQQVLDTAQWKTGKGKRLKPRLLHNIVSPILMVSKFYCCGNGHREIVACDPDIVNQLPDSFVSFVTSHRSGVTKHLLSLCEQLLDKGLSLTTIEGLNKERYETMYDSMKSRFLTDLNNCRSLGYSSADNTIQNFSELNWSFAGVNLVSSAIISNFQRSKTKYRKLFSSLPSEWISCDHTYKSVTNIGYHRPSDGKWIKRYKGFFIIVNEKGQPIQWKFTQTEKFEEVSTTFCQLAEHFKQQGNSPKGIFTDTCCKWASKFAEVFPGVPVKLDIFHAVQRFTSSIPKRKQYHAQIARDYSLVFRDSADLGESRMTCTPDKHVILENMEKFERKWKDVKYRNGQNVLNENAIKEIKNIKVHIGKGCLANIPPGCGTNRNERLNRHLNKFLSNNKISVSLAYARCFRLFSQLKSMKAESKEMFSPRSSCVGSTEFPDGACSRLESFGIDDSDLMEESEKILCQWNINNVNERSVHEVACVIQALLRKQREQLPTEVGLNPIDHTYSTVPEDRNKSKSLVLLHNAVCLWRTYVQLSSTFGKKVVDYELMGINVNKPVSVNSHVNSIPSDESANSPDDTSADESLLRRTANAWRYEVVNIPGDGNCFFTAVAFHLHQIFATINSESDIARNHLEAIGIHENQSIPSIANVLLRLIVEEWTGTYMGEYQNFLSDSNIDEEAQEFLSNGHFSTSLGDAMHLATANVLQIPILILAPHHLIPFVSVFPRYNVECMLPIPLAYDNNGPGHYDALIISIHDDETNSANVNENEDHGINSALSTEKLEGKAVKTITCRCGINSKKREALAKGTPQRTYKSRCKCISSSSKCSSRCKCQGACGNTKCKGVKGDDGEPTKRRQSRKRGQHPIKTSPKKHMKMSPSKSEGLNVLEYFIVVSLVNYIISIGLSYNSEDINELYNDIINLISEEEGLMFLPVGTHSPQRIESIVRKIKNRKDSIQ